MKHYFEPRKKKLHGITVVGATKIIRIDSRTQIEVSASIPDNVAIARYNEKHRALFLYDTRTPNNPVKAEFREIPVGSIEDLASVVEDLTAPETE